MWSAPIQPRRRASSCVGVTLPTVSGPEVSFNVGKAFEGLGNQPVRGAITASICVARRRQPMLTRSKATCIIRDFNIQLSKLAAKPDVELSGA